MRFRYVLKPEWVTEESIPYYMLLWTQKAFFLPAQQRKCCTRNNTRKTPRIFLLGLMEEFELCFPLNNPEKQVLIPELLADQQPKKTLEFRPSDCLNFGYRYSIVPTGLLPRFIVRTHHLSELSAGWKSGVILRDPTSRCSALIRSDAAERQVRIDISGPENSAVTCLPLFVTTLM